MVRTFYVIAIITVLIFASYLYSADLPFSIGEKLTYVKKMGGNSVGRQTIQVVKETEYNGKPALLVKMDMTMSIVSSEKTSDVEMHIEGIIDKQELYPLKMESASRNAMFEEKKTVEFDQIKHKAKVTVIKSGQKLESTYAIPPNTHDMISNMFYVRNKKLHAGDTFVISQMPNLKMTVSVIGKDKIKVPAGTFQTTVLEMSAPMGKMKVWLSDDDKRIPVKFDQSVPVVGFIENVLTKVE